MGHSIFIERSNIDLEGTILGLLSISERMAVGARPYEENMKKERDCILERQREVEVILK